MEISSDSVCGTASELVALPSRTFLLTGPLLSLHHQLIDDARHAFGAAGDRRGSRLRRA